jgi:subtilisin family serine protease
VLSTVLFVLGASIPTALAISDDPTPRIVPILNPLNQTEHLATTLAGMYSALHIDPTQAGEGIKVGVIDMGIAVYGSDSLLKTNGCFDDTGYPVVSQLGDTRFTNNKVIVARTFAESDIPNPDGASAQGSHGSHVAGIIGCNSETPTNIHGVDTGIISGVAPRVLLGSYVVAQGFDDGTNSRIRESAIANAIDAAVADGMQIINISIGGPEANVSVSDNVVNKAVSRAYNAGVLVVIAAGNDGPSTQTITSPGIFQDVVTVGSTNGGRVLFTKLTVGSQTYSQMPGNIGISGSRISARLAIVRTALSLSDACDASDLESADLSGKIAIVQRGTCTFYDKIKNLESAGAVGVIVVNASGDDSTPRMGSNGKTNTTIPAILLPSSALANLTKAFSTGQPGIFSPTALMSVPYLNEVSEFSSKGPSVVTGLVKPDILAPGGNILSASYSRIDDCSKAGNCFEIMSGTSMAAPYVVGVAAVLRQGHPDWSIDMLRSALIHTANQESIQGVDYGVVRNTGNGLVDPLQASTTSLGFDRESLLIDAEKTVSFRMINNSDHALTAKFSSNSLWLKTEYPTVTIPANSQVRISLALNSAKDPHGGIYALTATYSHGSSIRILVRHRVHPDQNENIHRPL